MEYNTTRTDLILREYGRNFHKLVDHINGVKEKEKRNELSKTLVDMMKVTHPSLGDQSELEAKLWDDLYIMSDYSLDIDSSFIFSTITLLSIDSLFHIPKKDFMILPI